MKTIGGLVVAIILAGCTQTPEDVARSTCQRAIRNQFIGSSVRVNGVNHRNGGYLVHTTATLAGGIPVTINCWTHANGSIDEIRVSE